MYYMRTRSAAPPIQFTVDQKVVQQVKEEREQLKRQQVKEEREQLKREPVAAVNGGEMASVANGEGGEGEGQEAENVVPMIDGKVDTESQAYKDALLVCSRENKEACAMCSA